MSNETGQPNPERIDQMLAAWDEHIHSGAGTTLEEFLQAFPQELHLEFRRCLTVEDQLGVLLSPSFPAPAFSDYEALEEIGRGGMGIVYRARQISLDRIVALKQIVGIGVSAWRERFITEARVAAQLNHPNIVPVYAYGEENGEVFLTMECVEGNDLQHLVKSGPQQGTHAAQIIQQVASAVHHAHEKGVIHRDLSPRNVLMDAKGCPRVTDFGLAKILGQSSEITRTGAVIGTPGYYSPEQAQGRPVEVTTDVYGLGAVLYALLTGGPPFQGNAEESTTREVIESRPQPPSLVNPGIDRDLETICLRCLEKRSDDRYSSAEAVDKELGRYLRGEPIQARPLSPLARGWRWCKRNPATAFSIVASLVALISLSGLTVAWQFQRSLTLAKKTAENERDSAKKARDSLDNVLSVRRVNQSLEEWTRGDFARARELLRQCPERYRGWEWNYANRVCHPELAIHRHHTQSATAVAFSPDGQRIVSGSVDGTIAITSVLPSHRPLIFRGHPSRVNCVAFSPDGKLIASASDDSTVRLSDTKNGHARYIFTQHKDKVNCVAFSPNGNLIASGSEDGTLAIWHRATGKIDFIRETTKSIRQVNRVTSLGFDGTGQFLACSTSSHRRDISQYPPHLTNGGQRVITPSIDDDFLLWIGKTKEPRMLPSGILKIYAPELEPHGVVQIWDIKTHKVVNTYKRYSGSIDSVAFASESHSVMFNGGVLDHDVYTWDLREKSPPGPLKGHADDVTCVACSTAGSTLVSGSRDGTVKLWNHSTREQEDTLFGHTSRINSVALSPDSKQIVAAAQDGTVRVWRPSPLKKRFKFFRFNAIDAGPDGREIVLVSSLGAVLFLRGSSELRGVGFQILQEGGWMKTFLNCVVYSPDGKLLAAGSWDKTITVFERQKGKPIRTLEAHRAKVNCLAFRPDGEFLISGAADGELIFWRMATGKPVFTVQTGTNAISSVAYSPDGKRIAIAFYEGGFEVWDAKTRTKVYRRSTGLGPDLAFDPRGSAIVTASSGAVTVWSAANGEKVLTMNGQDYPTNSVAYSPDGTRIAAAYARTIRIWDSKTGQEVLTLRGHQRQIIGVAFSSDGQRLISLDRVAKHDTGPQTVGSTVRLWDATPLRGENQE